MKLEKIFSTREVSKILNLPMKKLRFWKDAIGYVQLGSRIYFRQSDLESFLETHLMGPAKTVRRRRLRLLGPLMRAVSRR